MAYLIDTDWAIDVLGDKGPAATETRRIGLGRIAISRITVAELYHGAFTRPIPDANLIPIRHLLASCQVLGISDEVAERFGELRALLWRRGEKVADFDLLIAATAIEHDLTLLTFNRRHFDRVPDLRVYQVR